MANKQIYILFFFPYSKTRYLNTEEIEMMKSLVRECSLPFQTPMEVKIHKKILREDPHTGRKIEFSSGLSGVVSFLTAETSSYGEINSLFSYRAVHFACCSKFDNAIRRDGLGYVADKTLQNSAILPLDALSCPLVFATGCDNELWILSV